MIQLLHVFIDSIDFVLNIFLAFGELISLCLRLYDIHSFFEATNKEKVGVWLEIWSS